MAEKLKVHEADFDSTVKQKKKGKRRGRILALVIVLAGVAAGFYFCASKLFFVKSVLIKDVTEESKFVAAFPYTEEEMLQGMKLEKNSGLYDFTAAEAEKNARINLPYIKEIDVSRRWPSTVVAKTVLEVPTYYVIVDNDFYILSDEIKVLERTESSEKIELNSLIRLDYKTVHSCIVGEKLGISEDIQKIIFDIEAQLVENGVKNEVTSIDVSDKFNLSITYGTKYIVKLGDSKSLSTKLEFMKRIIEDRVGDVVGGVIDVSDEKNREAIYKKFN
ncbi:MAG: FtsQ-type POTRA domain-containing protein [Clostridia bacterium]|nr:FtsQ-type POTRA domain-containing protein [Clostridia bacterium]